MLNVAMMTWQSPLDPSGTPKAAFIAQAEWAFLWLYTAEMIIKITAYVTAPSLKPSS